MIWLSDITTDGLGGGTYVSRVVRSDRRSASSADDASRERWSRLGRQPATQLLTTCAPARAALPGLLLARLTVSGRCLRCEGRHLASRSGLPATPGRAQARNGGARRAIPLLAPWRVRSPARVTAAMVFPDEGSGALTADVVDDGRTPPWARSRRTRCPRVPAERDRAPSRRPDPPRSPASRRRAHLQPSGEQVAPVRALARVAGQADECGTEIGALRQPDERGRHAASDLLQANLDSGALDDDGDVLPCNSAHGSSSMVVGTARRPAWRRSVPETFLSRVTPGLRRTVASARCPAVPDGAEPVRGGSQVLVRRLLVALGARPMPAHLVQRGVPPGQPHQQRSELLRHGLVAHGTLDVTGVRRSQGRGHGERDAAARTGLQRAVHRVLRLLDGGERTGRVGGGLMRAP